ncbi:uncharacterized protein LOC144081958 [Stigmatopora argus]
MATNMPTDSFTLEPQLLSIMGLLVKAAVVEIKKVFSENSASLRLQLNQSLKANENLRMKMKTMRSEICYLRLQSRSNRPGSLAAAFRANVSKIRSKTPPAHAFPRSAFPIVLKPPIIQESPSVPLHLAAETYSPYSKERPVGESPGIILIKEEEDIGLKSEPSESCDAFTNPPERMETVKSEPAECSSQTASNGELKIVNVHGRAHGPLKDEMQTLFATTDQKLFNSQDVNHDGFSSVLPSGDDKASLRSDQLDGIPSSQSNTSSHTVQYPRELNPSLPSHPVDTDSNSCGLYFSNCEEPAAHRASHAGEPHISCSMCGKSFASKATRAIHMRIHTGVKPYVCSICGKRFTQNGGLKIHLRTHSGEKPYTCVFCMASFNNPSNLRRHMITHSADGPSLQIN